MSLLARLQLRYLSLQVQPEQDPKRLDEALIELRHPLIPKKNFGLGLFTSNLIKPQSG